MTCANRTDTPGFFTPCRKCPCGEEVKAEESERGEG